MADPDRTVGELRLAGVLACVVSGFNVKGAAIPGACFWSVAALAKRAAMSERSAQRVLPRLEGAGWIEVRRTRGRQANTIFLRYPTPSDQSGLNPDPHAGVGQRTGEPTPTGEGQPTPTGECSNPDRPVPQPRPSSVTLSGRSGDQGGEDQARDPLPPDSDLGDEPEAADDPEARRWEGFTDTQRTKLEAIAALGALLAHPKTGEDLRRDWLKRTRGLSRELVVNVLDASRGGFPSDFGKAAKAFATQIDQELKDFAETKRPKPTSSIPPRDEVGEKIGRLRAAQALVLQIRAAGFTDGFPGASPEALAALSRLDTVGVGKVLKAPEDLDLVQREWEQHRPRVSAPELPSSRIA